ncbi:unnamed protein product [Allacma fusca]|uniref:BACK domain-containing protein n=1 Tax=Allacma fusca TaxID=39272 RepID=A0A8J2NYS4_9HEXA|nr:unnamed protein product [Allacma fusca]
MSGTNNIVIENPFGEPISTENVQIFLKFSRRCYLSCVSFIQSGLTQTNCIPYLQFGISENCEDLLQVVVPFIWKNAKPLIYQPDFLDLSTNEINYLMKPAFCNAKEVFEHGLLCESLSEMLLAVYAWMNVDPEHRQIEPSVNILDRNEVQPGCSYHECKNRSKRSAEDDVTAIHDPRSVILEIDLTGEHQEIGFAECRILDTRTHAPCGKMYFMSGKGTKILFELDLKKSVVESIVRCPFNSSCSVMVCQTDCLVVMCTSVAAGFQGNHETTPIVWSLSLKEKVWKKGPSMTFPRSQFSCVFGDDALYVLGGMQKRESPCVTVERLCIPSGHILGSWETIAEIPFHRYYSSVGFLNGKIYVVGGQSPYHTSQMYCSNSLYELDLQTKVWTRKATMKRERIGLSIVGFNSCLFAIGGGEISAPWGVHCEVYHPKTNKWSRASSMNKPRRNAGTFIYNGKIHVVGGHPGCPTVEEYDTRTKIWKVLTNYQLPTYANCKSVAFSG